MTELGTKLVITVVRWVKISGMHVGGSMNLKQNR